MECYFEKENIWTFDSKGELFLTIMSSLAQEESCSISENVTWGQRKRFADGKVTVPFKRFLGYDRGEDGNLVINEEQAAVVRRIYGMFLQGRSPICNRKGADGGGHPDSGRQEKLVGKCVLSENIDKHFDSHNHVGHYVISVVMLGTVAVYLENREVVCRRGDVFIIPPYAVHSVRQGRDARLLSMCAGTAFIEETDLETAEGIVQELLMEAMEQGIFGWEQKEKLLTSVRTVYRLLDNGRKEMDAGIKILTDKITSHPEQKLPIETLAADIFVSKYYLIRKFKSSIGMTPHQFCIQNRIRKSQGLLDEEKTISRIAAEMGFYDQSHFDKAFQRIVGISPSEYVHSKKQIAQGT